MFAGLMTIRWLPYALIGVAVLGLVWVIHGKGYNAGYNAADTIHQEAENARLVRKAQVARKVADIDLTAVVVTATKKENLRVIIRNIKVPTDTACVPDRGLLEFFNEAVRAASPGAIATGLNASVGPHAASRYTF